MGQHCWKSNSIEEGLLAIESELRELSDRKADAKEELKALQSAQHSLLQRAARSITSSEARTELLDNQKEQLRLQRRIQQFDKEASIQRDNRDKLEDSEHILKKSQRMKIVERSMGRAVGKMKVDPAQDTMDDLKDHQGTMQEMSEVYEEPAANAGEYEEEAERIVRDKLEQMQAQMMGGGTGPFTELIDDEEDPDSVVHLSRVQVQDVPIGKVPKVRDVVNDMA